MRDKQSLSRHLTNSIPKILFTLLTLTLGAFAGSVDDIEFSVERGFYDNAFDVVLSTATSDATIYYTLDGSDPCGTAVNSALTPVTVHIDPNSTYGGTRPITPAVTLKACGSSPTEDKNSAVAVATYIFVDNVVAQSASDPGSGWPSPNTGSGQHYDYGMNGSVATFSEIRNSLLSAPTISMVTDLSNLFDQNSGIYENATASDASDPFDSKWERAGSIELINPNGDDGFQQNCGIRLRGGYSRSDFNPKHSFKVYFDKDYGEKYLEFPLFGYEGVQKYRKIGFRTAQNYSWNMWGDGGDDSRRNTFLREPLARDIQRAQGRLHAKSFNFHLYVNGMYWGLYMVQEAASAKYATQYLGENKDLYDVINTEGGRADATDGTLDIFYALYEAVQSGNLSDAEYYALQGLASNGISRDPAKFHYLDAANLIDYMLAIYYTGDIDAPVSKWHNNQGINNFYGIISQVNPEGFQWVRHDAEHSFDVGDESRVGPYNLNGREYFNPQTLHEKLISNNEYKMLFRDLAYRNFYNNGPMTTDSVQSMLSRRIADTEGPITAEAARWGDTKVSQSRTKATWWNAVNNLQNYVNTRTNIVKQQLKDIGWFTNLKPPVAEIDATGELVNDRFIPSSGDNAVLLTPELSNSTIYYTTDGTDPRAPGGSVSYSAQFGGNGILVTNAKTIKTRVFHTTQGWSPVREIFFTESIGENVIKFSEIHYKPDELGGDIAENALEFIEIKNASDHAVSLAGAKFSRGVLYSFPAETILQPNQYYVIAKNPGEFARRYGFLPDGHYSDELDNGDEKVEMVDAFGQRMDKVKYEDSGEWPESPDGDGPSLNILNLTATTDSDDPANWSASYVMHGTPGFENPAEAPYLVSMSVSPETALIGVGGSVTLVASATNQYGTPYTAEYTWSTTGTATVVDGVFTASEVGIYIVSVESEGQSVTAEIEVQAAPVLTTLSVSPQPVTIEIGTTQQFTATALDQYNNVFETAIVWSTNGGAINSSGLYTATAQGAFTVTATAGALNDDALVTVTATPTNISLGKNATASTFEAADLTPAMAVDASTTTRWSSDFLDNQWIAIDLNGEYSISEIVLNWETAASKSYAIQVSDNGQEWITVYTETNGNGGVDNITIPATTASYVRMYGYTRTTVYGHSLYSFDVYGTKAVTIPVLSSISLTPATATVTVGDDQQFTAHTFDQNGNPIDADVTWSIDANGTIDANGLVTTVATGSAIITFEAGGLSATAELTINEIPTLSRIAVSPATSTVYHGGPQKFMARGYDQFGTEVSVSVDWTTSAGTILDDGTYIAYELGTHTVTATDGAISGEAEITVIDGPVLSTIVISPGTARLAMGEEQQFTAATLDQYGNPFTADVTWSTSGSASISSAGVFRSANSGNFTVTAMAGGLVQTATVVVEEVNLIQNGDFANGFTSWYMDLYGTGNAVRTVNAVGQAVIDVVNPGTANWNIQFGQKNIPIELGKKYRYSFDAKAQSNRNLRTKLETDGTPWTNYAKLNQVAITTEMHNYSFEFIAEETDLNARLVFNSGEFNSDITLDNIKLVEIPLVVDPVLTTIVLTPATSSIMNNETQQFTAQGYDQFDAPITASYSWVVSGDGSIDANGLYTPVSGGLFTVSAIADGITGNAPILVTEVPVLASVRVSADKATIVEGDVIQLTVETLDQNGAPFSAPYTLTTTSGSIDASEVLSGASIGTVTVTAFAGAFEHSVSIQVTATPVPTSIEMAPTEFLITEGVSEQLIAVVRDQYGAEMSVPVTWAVDAGGTISNTGLFAAVTAGTSTITARVGVLTSQAIATVVAGPILNGIIVTPRGSSVSVGESVQFTAQTLDQFGNPYPTTVTWSATSGSISSTGLFVATAVGTVIITAEAEGVTSSTDIVVTQLPTNVALGKTATASTFEASNLLPAKAVDADVTTRWSSDFLDNQWIAIDLGGEFDVSSVKLVWEAAAAKTYAIQVKTATNTAWTEVYRTTTGNGGVDNIVLAEERVTNIRMYGYTRTTVYGISLFDFQVLAVPSIVLPPELTDIEISPLAQTVTVGETIQFNARGIDQYGNTFPTIINYIVDGGSIDVNGLYTASETGAFTVTAHSNGYSSRANIVVREVPVVTAVELSPENATVIIGETQQFSATAYDQYGDVIATQITWNAEGGVITANGLYTAGALGSHAISAIANGLTVTATVVVVEQELPNMLVNGDLSSGWNSWNMGVYSGASATRSVSGSQGTINISNGGTASWNIQLTQIGVNLVAGETYRFSFNAKASSNRTIGATLEKASSPWSFYGGAGSVALTTTAQPFVYEFTMSGSDNNARVTFNLGTSSSNVTLSDIKVVKLP